MIGVAAGALSGLLWGTADYLGGRASRGAGFLVVVAISQTAGLLVMLPIGLAFSDMPAGRHLALAALAGVIQSVAVAALYRALQKGAMSLTAPVSASGALLPIVAGLAAGERPGAVVTAGALAAVAGMVLVSTAHAPEGRAGLLSAAVAAVAIGFYWVIIGTAPDGTGLASVLVARAVSMVILVTVLLARVRREQTPSGRSVLLAATAGCGDVLAASAFAIAAEGDDLALAAALAALYPAVTAALAQLTLGERLGRLQAVGAAAIVLGIVVVAGAS